MMKNRLYLKGINTALMLGLLVACLLTTSVSAQNNGTQNQPLNLTAQGSLEWDQSAQTLSAIGEALAQQGENSIQASRLVAKYRENPTTGEDFDIYQLEGFEDITLTSGINKAYGDYLIYDLPQSLATLTGQDLRMTTPDTTLTARDKFTYNDQSGEFTAYGQAKIKRPTDQMTADRLVATLAKDAKGQQNLDTVHAFGNVKIQNQTETITGDRGLYRASNKTAEIMGNVVIRRGPNILKGQRATIDLNTQVSRLYGTATKSGEGRVSGTFYPGSTKKK